MAKTSIVLAEDVQNGKIILTEELKKVLGPNLVKTARENRAKVIADSMMRCTEDLFRQIEVMQQRKDECQKRIDDLEARIKDVEEGRFTVDKEGQVLFMHLPPPHRA